MQEIVKKVKRKLHVMRALRRFGTASFPTEAERVRRGAVVFERPVRFSVLVPLFNTPEDFLYEMIMSVMGQTYGNFELCLADGSDDRHSYVGRICRTLAEKDGRIIYRKLEKNEGISGNTNRCLEMATGDYIGLLDHDDVLHPEALYEYVKAINEKGADFLYCDEVTFKGGNIDRIGHYLFKPDFAVDNLRANNYICHFSCFKRELLGSDGQGPDGEKLFRSEFDGSQDHDMVLRLTAKASCIVHVPRVLYYWRSAPGSTAKSISAKEYAVKAGIGAVSAHLKDCGFDGFEVTSSDIVPTIYRVKYRVEADPKDFLLFMDEGCSFVNEEMRDEMLMYAQRSDVGAVGAFVRDVDGRVVDAGMVLGMGDKGLIGHLLEGTPAGEIGYVGQLIFARNVSALSGLCMMVEKRKFEEVGGFDEMLSGELRCADLCLRLFKRGYVNVWTPFAEVVYKGYNDKKSGASEEEAGLFRDKWKDMIEAGDPYFNRNLSLKYTDCRVE